MICTLRLILSLIQWTCTRSVHPVTHAHTHTHPSNGSLSGTIRVSRYQTGKTNLDFTEARDSEWQWHQLGHMQVCTSLQTDNHASTPPLSFFTGRMPFLQPNQQRQSTEGTAAATAIPKPYHLLPHLNLDWFYLSGTGLPILSWKEAIKRV